MIDCLFTIDYEIYGNGEGALQELVYDPARRLAEIFQKHDARFVTFVEVAEFEMIEAAGTDPASDLVRGQIRDFHRDGFELGLHLHPQWYNARREGDRWLLDYDEYNLCVLPKERISEIVARALAYLRSVTSDPGFVPVSFRAGNWLFQPAKTAAAVLAENGFKIDSSVFKGGLQRNYGLDYRPAPKADYFWNFQDDANVPVREGQLLEIPTYTIMVPFWKMLTGKRTGLQRKGGSATKQSLSKKINRALDLMRPWYPLKFDFCRMTLDELNFMLDTALRADRSTPDVYKPIVAIGHTKDLTDFATVDAFLCRLKQENVKVCTFDEVYDKCVGAKLQKATP